MRSPSRYSPAGTGMLKLIGLWTFLTIGSSRWGNVTVSSPLRMVNRETWKKYPAHRTLNAITTAAAVLLQFHRRGWNAWLSGVSTSIHATAIRNTGGV